MTKQDKKIHDYLLDKFCSTCNTVPVATDYRYGE